MRPLRAGSPTIGCLAILFLFFSGPAVSAPVIVQEARIDLEVEVMLVEKDGGRSLGARGMEISAAKGGKLEIAVPWPESSGGPATLVLDASWFPAPPEETQEVTLLAVLSLRSGRNVRSTRLARLGEGGGSLFEVFAEADTRLVLSVKGERVTRPVVQSPSGAVARVRFAIAVERVEGDRASQVETNELSSFLGQGVEYAFHRGADETLESVRLVLTLRRIDGEVAEIEAEISASLPGEAGRILLSRQDRIIATRGATSIVTAVTGTPPAGYRFLVTPRF